MEEWALAVTRHPTLDFMGVCAIRVVWRSLTFVHTLRMSKILCMLCACATSCVDRCGSAAAAARVANHTSWRRLWDIALDHGVKGTRATQAIFRELCRPSSCFQCSLCDAAVSPTSSCLEHVGTNHPTEMENLSYDNIISLLIDADSTVSILSICRRVYIMR